MNRIRVTRAQEAFLRSCVTLVVSSKIGDLSVVIEITYIGLVGVEVSVRLQVTPLVIVMWSAIISVSSTIKTLLYFVPCKIFNSEKVGCDFPKRAFTVDNIFFSGAADSG